MIPILYRNDEIKFTSNGLGRLTDCISCTVTEERNGIYEVEFKYPITGKLYNQMIEKGGIISVIHDDTKTRQHFDIYAHTDPIDGIVTFNAHHISYRLNRCLVKPFTAASAAEAMARIPQNILTPCSFTFWTDKATVANFKLDHPANIREILGGTQGSILDTYDGGDYQFNNFAVRLYTNRGTETGVTIRYGKNLADITNEYDKSATFSAVLPYWTNEESSVIGNINRSGTMLQDENPWTDESMDEMEDGRGNIIYFRYPIVEPTVIDFSADFEEAPTVAELNEKAQSFMTSNKTWMPHQNIKVDFVQLWQTPEYESVASLQRVRLCDLVSVYYPEMGIIASSQKVIRVVYNVLLERYDEMELGMAKTTYAESIASTLSGDIQEAMKIQNNYIEQRATELQRLIEEQTELLTGGLGGHVVMNLNADGEPQEILIMDTDDIETAVNVLRLNKNGIGFSTNGYSGPYASAWTIDGRFNADFISSGSISANMIQSGTMSANLIRGGILKVGGVGNTNGQITVEDQNGGTIGTWTNQGINASRFYSEFDDGYFELDNTGLSIVTGDWRSETGIPVFITLEPNVGLRISCQNGFYQDLWQNVLSSGSIYISHSYWGVPENSGPYYHFWFYTDPGQSAYCGDIRGGLKLDNLSVTGTKSRSVETSEYGQRLLYCYETPSPIFGDIGEAVLDDTGLCYVFLDAVFAETISTSQYQVFLQKYGDGDCFVSERHAGYFVVQGTPGLSFGWEMKAKQAGYDQLRLERDEKPPEPEIPDYGGDAANYYTELMKEREAA